MGALVNLAGVGCIVVAGLAITNAVNTGGVSFAPPAFPDDPPTTPPPSRAKPRAATFSADQYGQFWIDGTANGIGFRFLVDTGAWDIFFNVRDARRLGIDVKRLTFDGRSSTANGVLRFASTRIANLTVGPFTAADVQVSILEGGLDFPLLGMTFLKRFDLSIQNGTLTLQGER